MCQVWDRALSEEERDQLGQERDWRYLAAPVVLAYCVRANIKKEDAQITIDMNGRPYLMGE